MPPFACHCHASWGSDLDWVIIGISEKIISFFLVSLSAVAERYEFGFAAAGCFNISFFLRRRLFRFYDIGPHLLTSLGSAALQIVPGGRLGVVIRLDFHSLGMEDVVVVGRPVPNRQLAVDAEQDGELQRAPHGAPHPLRGRAEAADALREGENV